MDPPKKETKESKKLSDGIKKFLAKKEEEEKQKQLVDKKKKEELLSLRSQDRKSFKRVQSMLNRTKSANKSVIDDAKDDINTSVTMAGWTNLCFTKTKSVKFSQLCFNNNLMLNYIMVIIIDKYFYLFKGIGGNQLFKSKHQFFV